MYLDRAAKYSLNFLYKHAYLLKDDAYEKHFSEMSSPHLAYLP